VPQGLIINNNQSDTFTQELRLSGDNEKLDWVAGFYYLQYNNSNVIGFATSADSPFGGPVEFDSFVDWDRDSYSLFGQIDYALTDQWTLSGGLRWIREESDFNYVQLNFLSTVDELVEPGNPIAAFLGPPYPPFSADVSDNLWAGRLAVDYRPSDQWMFYGSIDRGVKAPGFNGKLNDGSPALLPTEIPYDEEALLAYEVGFKSTLGDGRTRLDGSVYFYDYQDHQAFVFVGSTGRVQNTDAEYFGFELELTTRPVDALDLSFSVSWIDAQIDNLAIADNLFRDVEPPHTPEWQGAAIGRYTWRNVLGGGDIAWQVAVTYTDSRFHNYRNFDAQNMDSYTLVDTRLSWVSADGRWDIAIFGNNVFDEEYKIGGFDLATLCGCAEEAWGRPAWWGIQARFSTP
ncbi:MAG: TonB-dependent receptor, partial [Alphaproteobacteria bacterium]|nr:TonB-dependent receptor [Alphaproteobacteria bacterium]